MKAMNKPLMLGSAALLALAACTDPNQLSDPNNPNRNTQQGALLGAALGAAVGVARGDNPEERRRGAVVGAAVGAGAGAILGNQLDKQEAELRQSMGDDRVVITNTGDRLIVTMPQDILFPVDSAVVRGDLRDDLNALARNLQRYPNSSVRVIGHTDNTGAASYNMDLSQRRATSVSAVLIDGGVDPRRIRSIGRGEEQPVASNLTAEGRAQNRRVEIIILPTT